MDQSTRGRIRHIFLNPRLHWALLTAAGDFGMTLLELKREIADGTIVSVQTPIGERLGREELLAAAMRLWELGVIEEALGDDAAGVLPEAIRLVELRARVPRYQRDMLRYLARRDGTSVDYVLTRELEDLASANAEEAGGGGARVCGGAGVALTSSVRRRRGLGSV
jgi:hypothetical protein